MKLAPIHILIKDLSFMVIYFLIMKYNLTNETYLPLTKRNFPWLPEMSFMEMIGASFFYNIITLAVSAIAYFPIVYLTAKFLKNRRRFRLIATGILLTTTTPILYFALTDWKQNDYYLRTAESFAWVFCFIISIIVYYWFNRKNEDLVSC
jgi:ABC-type xylose transport system permease subunit